MVQLMTVATGFKSCAQMRSWAALRFQSYLSAATNAVDKIIIKRFTVAALWAINALVISSILKIIECQRMKTQQQCYANRMDGTYYTTQPSPSFLQYFVRFDHYRFLCNDWYFFVFNKLKYKHSKPLLTYYQVFIKVFHFFQRAILHIFVLFSEFTSVLLSTHSIFKTDFQFI